MLRDFSFSLFRSRALFCVGLLTGVASILPCAKGQSSANWAVTTFAGQSGMVGSDDGLAGAAHFDGPRGIVADSTGNIFVADTLNHTIRKITPGGQVSTVAGVPGQSGFADGPGASAKFNLPTGLAIDAQGNLYVADFLNNAVRKIAANGTVSTLVGGGPTSAGSTDGTGTAALFNQPAGLARDASGNLYVADSGNSSLRKIDSELNATTLAGADDSGQFKNPYGVAVDSSGTIYVADTFNHLISTVSPSGTVTPFAGSDGNSGSADGLAKSATFSGPSALVVAGSGAIYVTEIGNHDIRSIVNGTVTVIAGTPGTNGTTDGAGDAALFSGPQGLAVTADGTLYVCDTLNSTIRKIVQTSPPSGLSESKFFNISTRSYVGTGDDVMIAGFVIGGSVPKKVLIRANGPALQASNLTGLLSDPTLELHDASHGNVTIATNDNWGDEPVNGAAVAQANQQNNLVWPTGSKDAALVATLNPGAYTAVVAGKDNATGIALVEVYELDRTSPARLINISTRSRVQTGAEVQIAGFIISGSSPKKVLIRAGGPFLAQYNIASGDLLTDPLIELHDTSTVIGRSDDWSSDSTQTAALQQAFNATGAVPYTVGSKDAAMIMTLNPGNYTAIISGKNGGQGVALIEVNEIP